MADSLFWWGVGKIYRFGQQKAGHIKPSCKTKFMFWVLRLLQKKELNDVDKKHWDKKGWTSGKRPWR